MNHDSSAAFRPSACTVYVSIGPPVVVVRVITGSLIEPGSSPRTRVTASRTSLTARSMSLPKMNSTEVADVPSVTVDMMCVTSPTVATAFSTMRVTCVSSSAGAAPGSPTVTVTTGMSTSGNWLMPSFLNPMIPANVSRMKITILDEAGAGRYDSCIAAKPHDFDHATLARASLDARQARDAVASDDEHERITVAREHRRFRQRKRLRIGEQKFTLRECARLQARSGGQRRIHQSVARGGIDGRRDHAHDRIDGVAVVERDTG